MKRVYFNNNNQVEFLKKAIDRIDRPLKEIAKICGIDKRTLYDWRRGKYRITFHALRILSANSKIPIPKTVEILPVYWYVKKGASRGAINRNRLYGNPGTLEGRRKGGLVTIDRFRNNVDYAKRTGFKIRKEINRPRRSILLAEFIGIMLGDGSININQAKITLNSKTDTKYAYFIRKVIKKLFNMEPSIKYREKNTLEILIYSRNLVDFLIKCNLKIGNKVFNQVDVPKWIFKRKGFIKACLRGLLDTDGGIYFHNHTIKGIKYKNIGLCFTSNSKPLLNSVNRMFIITGIPANCDKIRHVSLYGVDKINKYFSKIGSSNIKHINRFKLYKTSKI